MNGAFGLSDRLALVTGSTRGIGRAVAEALRSAGAQVLQQGSSVGSDHGSWVIFADFSDPGHREMLAKEVIRRAGEPDILVLNASVQERTPWREISRGYGVMGRLFADGYLLGLADGACDSPNGKGGLLTR